MGFGCGEGALISMRLLTRGILIFKSGNFVWSGLFVIPTVVLSLSTFKSRSEVPPSLSLLLEESGGGERALISRRLLTWGALLRPSGGHRESGCGSGSAVRGGLLSSSCSSELLDEEEELILIASSLFPSLPLLTNA